MLGAMCPGRRCTPSTQMSVPQPCGHSPAGAPWLFPRAIFGARDEPCRAARSRQRQPYRAGGVRARRAVHEHVWPVLYERLSGRGAAATAGCVQARAACRFSAAQPPARRPIFHLSLKDHSHLASLPALREAGIASVKIEGACAARNMWRPRWPHAWPRARGCPMTREYYEMYFLVPGLRMVISKACGMAPCSACAPRRIPAAARAAAPRPARTVPPREAQRAGEHVPDAEREQRRIGGARRAGAHCLCPGAGGACARTEKFDTELCPCAGKDGRHALFCARGRSAGGRRLVWRLRASLAPCAARRWKKLLALRAAPPQRQCPAPPAPPLAAALQPGAPRNVAPQAATVRPVSRRRSSLPVRKKSGRRLNVCCCLCSNWASVPEPLRAKTWLELPRAEFTGESQLHSLLASLSGKGFAGFVAQNLAHFALPCAGPWMGGFGLNVTNAAAARAYLAMGCESVTASPS